MLSALHSSRRLVASLALGFYLAHAALPAALAETVQKPITPETITLTPDERILANHGAEAGAGTVGIHGSITAAPLMGTVKSSQAKATYSDSLWGSMLLNMAVQRDEELGKLATRLGFVNAMTMLSVAGVSGLGLAQSIYSYRQTPAEPLSINVTHAHGPGGHDHVHLPQESRIPATMGIIGSGVTIATLGTRAVLNKYYTHRITKRHIVIRDAIDHALAHLEQDGITSHSQQELTTLVGERAAVEFLMLWKVVHPEANRVADSL